MSEKFCNPHPCAPHGFDRTGSHMADEYVCLCDGWTPDRHCVGLDLEAELDAMRADRDRLAAELEAERADADHFKAQLAHFWVRLRALTDDMETIPAPETRATPSAGPASTVGAQRNGD